MSIDGLDAGEIEHALGPAGARCLASLSVVAKTASTQSDAARAQTPDRGCAVFFADSQTAGVGRQGRRWVSPPGSSLAFSLSRRFARSLSAMSGLSLAVGVAMAEALHALGFAQVRLKWPNDLMVDGRKLGGILIGLNRDGDRSRAVIGVGINVNLSSADMSEVSQPWCDLSQLGPGKVSRNRLAARMLDHLLPALEDFDADGLEPFTERWRRLDGLAGRAVQVTDGAQVHQGVCFGINALGGLRLDTDGGELHFQGGEVSLRRA